MRFMGISGQTFAQKADDFFFGHHARIKSGVCVFFRRRRRVRKENTSEYKGAEERERGGREGGDGKQKTLILRE